MRFAITLKPIGQEFNSADLQIVNYHGIGIVQRSQEHLNCLCCGKNIFIGDECAIDVVSKKAYCYNCIGVVGEFTRACELATSPESFTVAELHLSDHPIENPNPEMQAKMDSITGRPTHRSLVYNQKFEEAFQKHKTQKNGGD